MSEISEPSADGKPYARVRAALNYAGQWFKSVFEAPSMSSSDQSGSNAFFQRDGVNEGWAEGEPFSPTTAPITPGDFPGDKTRLETLVTLCMEVLQNPDYGTPKNGIFTVLRHSIRDYNQDTGVQYLCSVGYGNGYVVVLDPTANITSAIGTMQGTSPGVVTAEIFYPSGMPAVRFHLFDLAGNAMDGPFSFLIRVNGQQYTAYQPSSYGA
jgi:hypothetical protein